MEDPTVGPQGADPTAGPAVTRQPFVAPVIEEMGALSQLTQQDFSIPGG